MYMKELNHNSEQNLNARVLTLAVLITQLSLSQNFLFCLGPLNPILFQSFEHQFIDPEKPLGMQSQL